MALIPLRAIRARLLSAIVFRGPFNRHVPFGSFFGGVKTQDLRRHRCGVGRRDSQVHGAACDIVTTLRAPGSVLGLSMVTQVGPQSQIIS